MIINSQAFASSLKEGGKNKDSRIIYSERDEFGSRKPIDIIAANRPILILDEPQKLNGDATQNALKNFRVLFSMNFSATHVVNHNKVYSLDALDAYNQKLVKKIEVKGVDLQHIAGSDRYMYFEAIDFENKKPVARMEIFVNHANGVRRETHTIHYQDNLYETSNHVQAYKDLFVTDISAIDNKVSFSDGTLMHAGESVGDVSDDNKRRIQIRETILSHLNKEEKLFRKGIKVLSLFFIDEVAKYRVYDENGQERLGEYGRIFEEEFGNILRARGIFYDPEYIAMLKKHPVREIHSGYFSIDKKGHAVDSKEGKEDDGVVSAYDRILKHKELLIGNEDPIRFIFSHSALSEGWDNPNVFQICVLKHSGSTTRRRQEVGRGMRICVDQNGDRMDYETLGPQFHDVNLLTVIADEDYESFVKGLQSETLEVIRARIVPIDENYLCGRKIFLESGEVKLDSTQAKYVHRYLTGNWYIDIDDMPTDALKHDLMNDCLKPLPPQIESLSEGIRDLLVKATTPANVGDMYNDGRKPKIKTNKLNRNFQKKEFAKLWDEINHLYHYKVAFDSGELIGKAAAHIDEELVVAGLSYTVRTGSQRDDVTYDQIRSKDSFGKSTTKNEEVDSSAYSGVKYDLIGRLASGTGLTRKTIAEILKRITEAKFDMFRKNPEEFINKVTRLINEEKATAVIDHITYEPTGRKFDTDIFTVNRPEGEFSKAYESSKNVQDYIFTDSAIERAFAQELDGAEEVVVYAKLPDGKNGFYIPTPVGDYSPDWAIAFNRDSVRHMFFVAETKGSMSSMNLDRIEESKIKCASKLFRGLKGDVKFAKIDNYGHLLEIMRGE